MKKSSMALMVTVLMLSSGVAMAANHLQVNNAAAMNGTNYGLEVVIDDNSTATYVRSDHPTDETHFVARFWVNPANLANVSTTPGHNWFRFFTAADDTRGQHVVLFLKKSILQQNWRVSAWQKKNNGFFAFAGEMFWCPGASPLPFEMEVEWTAADPGMANGQLTVTKIATGASINYTTADDSNFQIDKVLVGFLNYDLFDPGPGGGSYYFDEYVSTR